MSQPCPYIEHKYRMAIDDGEVTWCKRDFLWVVPRLLAWKARAVERVEAEYAVHNIALNNVVYSTIKYS